MSETRDAFLSRLRHALGRDGDAAATDAVAQRLARHPRGPLPARGQLPPTERVELFRAMATEAAATVARVASPADIPAAVADYLARENLPAVLRMAPDPALAALPWSDRPLLAVTTGICRGDDATALTAAFGGVAETGTLALVSGPDTPTTLNLLPDTSIVVLPADAVVGSYEEIWDRLRARYGPGVMPRTVNFVTGPSRSADIEQTLQMGAHGPRRLHILLVDGLDSPMDSQRDSRGQAPSGT